MELYIGTAEVYVHLSGEIDFGTVAVSLYCAWGVVGMCGDHQ